MASKDDFISDKARIGYEAALEVLRVNTVRCGFSAAPERHANYYSVWARDHSITSIATVQCGDQDLVETAANGVHDLLVNQNENGQVPSYIEAESGDVTYSGYGGITTIDSNMWVVIAAAALHKFANRDEFAEPEMVKKYHFMFHLFDGLDPNADGLIEMPVAGDWADIMDRSYHVLYDEVLFYEALGALEYLLQKCEACNGDEDDNDEMRYLRRRIREKKVWLNERINSTLWFTRESIPRITEHYLMIETDIDVQDYPYYQTHVVPFKHYALAIITEIASPEQTKAIVDYVFENRVNDPFPIRCLSPAIRPEDMDWEEIYGVKEKPNEYHNGGIWPMISGFWIHALAKNGFMEKARSEYERFVDAMAADEWRFSEWYHGETGEPGGRTRQAWSAAGYMIATHALRDDSSCLLYGPHEHADGTFHKK